VAWDETPWGPDQGIGPLGVRAAVTRVDGDTTAYVLVDGNNMEPGLRERIVEEVTGVDRLEVVTSDTHIVNRVEAVNQVGEALPQDELGTLIDDLVHEALEDCEPAVAGLASERAEVTVFGNDRTETLASHANAMVSMGGAVAGAIILAVLSVSVFVFLLAGS
jgi:putative membrane protein